MYAYGSDDVCVDGASAHPADEWCRRTTEDVDGAAEEGGGPTDSSADVELYSTGRPGMDDDTGVVAPCEA